MKTQKGFTFVEVLVAIWVIGTALVAIVGLNVGNIKFSRTIDEISQAMFIVYDLRMRGYLQAKYNTEIPPSEYPENYETQTEVIDVSSLKEIGIPLLSNLKPPPIPLITVKTPSGKIYDVLGVSHTKDVKPTK